MKTYKIIFATFAVMVLGAFVTTSCSNDEISKSQTNNSSLIKREGMLDLSGDADFIELYELASAHLEQNRDVEQIEYFLDRIERGEYLDNLERDQFARSLGFQNRGEAADYTITFNNLYQIIDQRYTLSDFSQNELEGIFFNGFSNIATTSSSDDCYRRFNNCFNITFSIFAVAVTGCYTAGLAIAAANWWNAGLVGLGVSAVCIGAAYLGYSAGLDNCGLDWENCISS
mgnify:CR=1 FL=1